MPARMAFAGVAISAIFLVVFLITSQASPAAEDCLAKPNAVAPPGSHWYYRVDRTTGRECWYLGAEGGRVRVPARQDASPARSNRSKKSAQPAGQTPAAVLQVAAAEAIPAEAVFIETTPEQAVAPLSMARLDLPTSIVSVDGKSDSTGNSYVAGQSTADPVNETPLRSPSLSRADLSSAEQPPDFPISFAQAGAALGAMLGLAAIIGCMIFKLSARRRLSRTHSRDRGALTASTYWAGDQARSTPAAVTRQAGLTRRTGKAPPPPNTQVVDIEQSVRRLLQELQRRQHAEISNGVEDSKKHRADRSDYLMRRGALQYPGALRADTASSPT